jgi:hypothetical protein
VVAHLARHIISDRTLWCWGSNADGAIGDGTAWRYELTRVTDAR